MAQEVLQPLHWIANRAWSRADPSCGRRSHKEVYMALDQNFWLDSCGETDRALPKGASAQVPKGWTRGPSKVCNWEMQRGKSEMGRREKADGMPTLEAAE